MSFVIRTLKLGERAPGTINANFILDIKIKCAQCSKPLKNKTEEDISLTRFKSKIYCAALSDPDIGGSGSGTCYR